MIYRILLTAMFFCYSYIGYTQATIEYNMKMWTTFSKTLWDGNEVKTWGFSEGNNYPPLPGPTLYAEEGDTVIINIRNQSQPHPHTIHWHGLDVDQANDGVPQTSFVIEHMEDSIYKFVAPHPGTYLYHCHVASIIHVQMGMYGSFVVRPKGGTKEVWGGGPSYDKEYLWLMSEIDKSWHDNIPVHYGSDSLFTEFEVPSYEPDYFLINGNSYHQLKTDGKTDITAAPATEVVLLRLSNVGYTLNQVIFPTSIAHQIVAADGRPLPSFDNSDTLLLGPGERYEVLLDAPAAVTDSIQVNYLNINNLKVLNTQYGRVTFAQGVGVQNQIDDNFITIYPNPTNGPYRIKGKFDKGTLMDINGKTLQSFTSSEINMESYPKGTYFVMLKTSYYNKTIKLVLQ